VNVVSAGTSPDARSSWTAICAPALPFASLVVRSSLTKPTLTPPSRTSEPRVSAAPLVACTVTSSVGTNGSPLFAL
jgi:hypothetical protein